MKISRAKLDKMQRSGAKAKPKPEAKPDPKPSTSDEMRMMAETMAKQMQQKHNGRPITYRFETERDEDGRIKSITATPVESDGNA